MADPRCHGLGLDARCPGCLDCCGRESCPGCAACDDSRDDGASSSPGVSPSAAGAAGPARAAGVGGGDAPAPAVRDPSEPTPEDAKLLEAVPGEYGYALCYDGGCGYGPQRVAGWFQVKSDAIESAEWLGKRHCVVYARTHGGWRRLDVPQAAPAPDGRLEFIPTWREPSPEPPTLRDRFAMAALTGLSVAEIVDPDRAARWAYKLADAMLGARGGK